MAFLGCTELSKVCLNEGPERAEELCFFKTRVSTDRMLERLRKSASQLGVGLERVGRLVLSHTVNVVCRRLFANSDVESAIIPETVSEIETAAFAGTSLSADFVAFPEKAWVWRLRLGLFVLGDLFLN